MIHFQMIKINFQAVTQGQHLSLGLNPNDSKSVQVGSNAVVVFNDLKVAFYLVLREHRKVMK